MQSAAADNQRPTHRRCEPFANHERHRCKSTSRVACLAICCQGIRHQRPTGSSSAAVLRTVSANSDMTSTSKPLTVATAAPAAAPAAPAAAAQGALPLIPLPWLCGGVVIGAVGVVVSCAAADRLLLLLFGPCRPTRRARRLQSPTRTCSRTCSSTAARSSPLVCQSNSTATNAGSAKFCNCRLAGDCRDPVLLLSCQRHPAQHVHASCRPNRRREERHRLAHCV